MLIGSIAKGEEGGGEEGRVGITPSFVESGDGMARKERAATPSHPII